MSDFFKLIELQLKQRPWLPLLVILSITALVYVRSLSYPFYFDSAVVLTKPFLQSLTNLVDLSERLKVNPTRILVDLTFGANYDLFGIEPFSFRLTNLTIHLINTALAWVLISLLTPIASRHNPRGKLLIVTLVTAIFALHPIQTQAVILVVQRYVLMATFFYLLALISFIKYRLTSGKKWLLLLAISAFLGLLSKETVASLPLALIGFELIIYNKLGKKQLLVLSVGVVGLLTSWLLVGKVYNPNFMFGVKTTPLGEQISQKEYALTQTRVLVKYMQLLIAPINQSVDHYVKASTQADRQVVVSSLILLGLLFAVIKLPQTYKLTKLGFLIFFVSLLIESSVITIADVMFEHRLYLATFGFGLVIAETILALANLKKFSFNFAQQLTVICVVVVLLSTFTIARIDVWSSRVSLWTDATLKSPLKARTHLNLGTALMTEHRLSEAFKALQKALTLQPNLPGVYRSLGTAYAISGEQETAKKWLQEAVKLDPNDASAHKDLGQIYLDEEEYGLASVHLLLGLQAADNTGVKAKLALSSFKAGSREWGEAMIQEAIKEAPNQAEGYYYLAIINYESGRPTESLEAIEQAVKLEPTNREYQQLLSELKPIVDLIEDRKQVQL